MPTFKGDSSSEQANRRWFWLICVVLLLCTLSWVRFILEEISPYYPVMSDQGYYLKSAHQYWSYSQAHGYWAMLKVHFLHNKPALGFYPSSNQHMALLASFLFPLLGASRLGALSIHLGSWLLLLSFFSFVLRKITQTWTWPAIGVGLLLSTSFGFAVAGGSADFRMEFPAACWMGIALLSWCHFFQAPQPRHAWLASGATFGLFLFRLITLPYWAVPLSALFAYVVWKEVFRCAFWPLISLGAGALLLLIWDHAFIQEYYFGAFVTEARMRTLSANSWDEIFFFPRSLWVNHFGAYACGISALIGVGFLIFPTVERYLYPKRISENTSTLRFETLLLPILLIFSTLFILSQSPAKTPQHAGIIAPSLAITMILLVLRLTQGHVIFFQKQFAALILILGFFFWQHQLMRSAPFQGTVREEAMKLNPIFELATRHINQFDRPRLHNLDMPNLVVLDWLDGLNHNSITLYGREHLGYGKVIELTVPRFIFAMSREELLKAIHTASAVILPVNPEVLTKRPWPVMQSVRDHFPLLASEIRKTMKFAKTFQYNGVTYELYFTELDPTLKLAEPAIQGEKSS